MAAAADKSASIDSRTLQIPRDGQGSDNPIPLSPQWLLPKPGENKSGTVTSENHTSQLSSYASRPNTVKSGNGDEVHDTLKKKDVFRPSMLDSRDRWRDEERETNTSLHKDRWREGDKELGDNRKVDRWNDNSSGRHFGDARRPPSERWTDSGNRDGNNDRRESKWNTRWGPDRKDSDSSREKWTDSGKDIDFPLDKGLSHPPYQEKDEREGDHYRPWRSSSAQSRGRAEPLHNPISTPNKQVPMFTHGRGRGENANSTFSLGRGRVNPGGSPVGSSPLRSLGSFSEKGDSGHGETFLGYSRTKLLDVYRMTDVRSSDKFVDGFVKVPSLTLEEPTEPLAFLTPGPEELDMLKGIDKGDILSSGAPPITKDGSIGRNASDLPSRRIKHGSRDDLPPAVDNYKGETESLKGGYLENPEGLTDEKHLHTYGSSSKVEATMSGQPFSDYKSNNAVSREDGASYRSHAKVASNREVPVQANSSVHPDAKWRSSTIGERATSHEWRDSSGDVRSRTSDIGWSQPPKDLPNEWDSSLAKSSYSSDGPRRHIGDESLSKRQPSPVVEREQETRIPLQTSPEELVLYYKDPQGAIQGPFEGVDIIGWFEAGYFGIDLQVRLANAPHDSPFALLGDVMPHLRAKVRPPPGFGTPKPSEIVEGTSKPNFGSFSKLSAGSSENDLLKSEPRYNQSSSTEAENRFLESLMSGNTNEGSLEKLGLSEGIQGYLGNNSSSNPALDELAKRLTLERQKSLSNPYSLWSGRDLTSAGLKSDILQDPAMPPSNILSAVAGNLRQPPNSQNAEFMSILNGLSDRSTTSGLSSGVSSWSNFPAQGVVNPLQDKLNFPLPAALGIQQRLQPPTPSSLNNLRALGFENSSAALTPEKLLASGLTQDPQLLNLLQQQYLSQLQPQAPPNPLQQLSLLDELLLLKQQQQQQQQQQKQEEQQQLLRKQQLLSQTLSEHQSLQRFGDQSYGQLQTSGLPSGNASMDLLGVQPLREVFPITSQHQVPNVKDERPPNFIHLPPNIPLDEKHNVSETSFTNLPHQIFRDAIQEKGWGTASLPELRDDVQWKSSSLSSPVKLRAGEPALFSASEGDACNASGDHLGRPVEETFKGTQVEDESGNPVREQSYDLKDLPASVVDKPLQAQKSSIETSGLQEAKPVDAREVKKSSEKKSRKQKSSKAQPSDTVKEVPKSQQPKQFESEWTSASDANIGPIINPDVVADNMLDKPLPSHMPTDVQTLDSQNDSGQVGSMSQLTSQAPTVQRAWKHAPGFKPKSLLEIQQEEQRRAQAEEQRRAQAEVSASDVSTSLSSMNVSTPWAGIVSNSDQKVKETKQDTDGSHYNMGLPEGSTSRKIKKSQLHDMLAEVPAKSTERDVIPGKVSSSPLLPGASSQSDTIDNDDFIEAKETKKSRKKSAKAKGAGSKVSVPVSFAEISVGSSPNEKGKSLRQPQQEKEVLPAVPSGPSLGDFVVWKGDHVSTIPAPAWSTDAGKLERRTSLRDILKEQGKTVSSAQTQNSVSIPQKSLPPQASRGSASSRPSSASSPAKTTAPMQNMSQASSQSKHKVDDDLFWGPLDQPNQEKKQSDYPNLANQAGWGKNAPGKGIPSGSSNRQKSGGGNHMESSFSPSPASKGKREASSKHSEAKDFRDWCESECVRLIGSRDTSFLEFCLKQSRSEAEILLIQNLGSYDPDHEFIEKFLNYKDFLPSDVLEIAFHGRGNNRNVTSFGAKEVNSMEDDFWKPDQSTAGSNTAMASDGSASKGGGKKKGKKGKKVSPSVLGFNVVSNRIMMGEIQTVED